MAENKIIKAPILQLAGVVVIAVLIAFAYYSFIPDPNEEETRIVYCGANNTNPAVVFINPTKAFPSFAKEYTSSISASLHVVDSLAKTSISNELQDKIVELREKLNQENIRIEMLLKSYFLGFNQKPCDSEISKRYFDFLDEVTIKNFELEKLRADLTKSSTKGAASLPTDTIKYQLETDSFMLQAAINNFTSNYEFVNQQEILRAK